MSNKIQGGTKSSFRLLFNLKGGFQNAGKDSGGRQKCFQFLRGALSLPTNLKGGIKNMAKSHH